MKTKLHRILFLIPAFVFAMAITACENTREGIGEDMQDAGEAVEDAAEDANN